MSTIFLSELVVKKDKSRKKAFGIVAYLRDPLRILLAHPGGPEHTHLNRGYWSIPKGGEHNDTGWQAAVREFKEETNLDLPPGAKEKNSLYLETITQRSGKIVTAWGVEMENDDISNFKSNLFKMVWPPAPNGTEQHFPEMDEVRWFTYQQATRYIRYSQLPFLVRLKHQIYDQSTH